MQSIANNYESEVITVLRSSYSESAYGRMRDRQAEKEKQSREITTNKKKSHVPYKTLMTF